MGQGRQEHLLKKNRNKVGHVTFFDVKSQYFSNVSLSLNMMVERRGGGVEKRTK